jgi:hypothetical protein
VVQTDLAYLGRRVGTLLVANIAGSTIGALLTGWLLLTWLGTAGTFRFLVALSVIFPVLAATVVTSSRVRRYAVCAVIVVTSALVRLTLPDAASLWARLHNTTMQAIAFAEDGSGLSVLKARGEHLGRGADVYVNGLGQSHIPYGGSTHKPFTTN